MLSLEHHYPSQYLLQPYNLPCSNNDQNVLLSRTFEAPQHQQSLSQLFGIMYINSESRIDIIACYKWYFTPLYKEQSYNIVHAYYSRDFISNLVHTLVLTSEPSCLAEFHVLIMALSRWLQIPTPNCISHPVQQNEELLSNTTFNILDLLKESQQKTKPAVAEHKQNWQNFYSQKDIAGLCRNC